MQVLSVIIPVYNERGHVAKLVDAVRKVPASKEVILVDDGSNDGTTEIIRERILTKYPDTRYFRHPINRGKGAAIQTGIQNMTGDLVVIQDADLEYDPQDYPVLMKCFENSSTQVVYGSRFLSGRRVTNPFHYGVNRLITVFGNMLFGSKLTDLETCYKMGRPSKMLCEAGFST